MKRILITYFFLTLAISAIAQKGYTDLPSMFLAEGKRNGWTFQTLSATTSGTVLAGTAAQNGIPGYVKYKVAVSLSFTTVPRGKAILITGGTIACTKQAAGTYNIDNLLLQSSYPAFSYESSGWQHTAGGKFDVAPGGICRFGSVLLNPGITMITEPWSSTVAPVVASTATVEYGITCGLTWLEVTDDLNYTADYVIDVIGDSNPAGTGPTGMNTMFVYLMRNYWASKGYNVRIRNLSVSGVTAFQQEYRMNSGGFNFPVKSCKTVLIVGTNDVLTATNADSTAKRVTRIARFQQMNNPGSTVDVFPITPLTNTTNEAAAGVTATAITNAINALGSRSIRVVPGIRTAFVATNASYFAGDGVHLSDLGNATEWGVYRNWLEVNAPTLPYTASAR